MAAATPAQVFVVDAAGGGQFTDLPAAVAGVPEGATLLVRSGSYSSFQVQGKALSIVGEGAIQLGGGSRSIVLEGTSQGQPIVLRNLDFASFPYLQVRDAQGPVIVESCRCGLSSSDSISIERSRNVQILRCDFAASSMSVYATDSSILIAGTLLRGYSGGIHPIPGATAMYLNRSEAVAIASGFAGGRGAQGLAFCDAWLGCLASPGTAGGDGCQLYDSTLTAIGCTIVAGAGGASVTVPCWTSCQSGAGYPGQSVRTVGMSRLVSHSEQALAEVSGTPSIGSRVEFVYRGTVPAPLAGVLVFSDTADIVPFAPIGHGVFLAAANLLFGPYSIAISPFRVPLDVPSSAQLGRLYFGQFVVLGRGSPLASSPFTFSVVR